MTADVWLAQLDAKFGCEVRIYRAGPTWWAFLEGEGAGPDGYYGQGSTPDLALHSLWAKTEGMGAKKWVHPLSNQGRSD